MSKGQLAQYSTNDNEDLKSELQFKIVVDRDITPGLASNRNCSRRAFQRGTG